MLELHHVKIDGLLADCSLTVGDGEMVGIYGEAGTGKTTLLRAVLGMVSIDGGHISIDGELLTPLSAPFFRRATAYVPQQLSLVEGYDTIAQCDATVTSLKINSRETSVQESSQGEEDGRTWPQLTADEQFLSLVHRAVGLRKTLVVVDEPSSQISEATRQTADKMLLEAARNGASVLVVNPLIAQKQIQL